MIKNAATYLAAPTLLTLFSVGALFSPQSWPLAKILVLVMTLVITWGLGGWLFWRAEFRGRPDFVTDGGAKVWTNGCPVTLGRVCEAIWAFCAAVGDSDHSLGGKAFKVSAMFKDLNIVFSKDPVTFKGKRYAGLQHPNTIRVQWRNGFGDNAFFHECLHLYQDRVQRLPPDYKHERDDWKIIEPMKAAWKEREG